MKLVELEQTNLDTVVSDAQQEQVVITRNGTPVAIIFSTMTWNDEQLQLVQNDSFWQLITKRRLQKTINRAELERRLSATE